MGHLDRIDLVERALRSACGWAMLCGLILIRHAFERRWDGEVVGVCPFGAVNVLDASLPELEAEEVEAIEAGWDGEPSGPWGELGARLAAEFSPIAASTLEGT